MDTKMKVFAEEEMERGASIAFTINTGKKTITDPSHYHSYFEFQFMQKGERNIVLKNDIYKLREGDFVLYAPYTMHNAYEIKKTYSSRIILYFRPQVIVSEEARKLLENSSGVYQPAAEYGGIIRRMLGGIISEKTGKGPLHSDYAAALLNCMMLMILRQVPVCSRPEKQLQVSMVMKYLEQHYQDDNSLTDLADRFSVSTYYLCRKFKCYTNTTIKQYINTLRIMNAKIKLLNTDKKITEIAIESGYADNTQFYRVFKAHTGVSPSEYRSMNK